MVPVCIANQIIKYCCVHKIKDSRSFWKRFLHIATVAEVILPPENTNGKFLHSAVSSLYDHSGCFMLHPRQTCSFQHQLDFSGKHSATLQLLHKDYLFTYPPLSIARYSFIQLNELEQCRGTKLCKLRNSSKRIQTQVFLFGNVWLNTMYTNNANTKRKHISCVTTHQNVKQTGCGCGQHRCSTVYIIGLGMRNVCFYISIYKYYIIYIYIYNIYIYYVYLYI